MQVSELADWQDPPEPLVFLESTAHGQRETPGLRDPAASTDYDEAHPFEHSEWTGELSDILPEKKD